MYYLEYSKKQNLLQVTFEPVMMGRNMRMVFYDEDVDFVTIAAGEKDYCERMKENIKDYMNTEYGKDILSKPTTTCTHPL